MPDQGVITQNLREFTVKILKLPDEKIVGTGLAVFLDGRVATCAHVVEAAGVNPRAGNGGEVGVYFPQARVSGERLRRAEVAAFFPEHDDDLVLLKLREGPDPLAPEQLPVLGQAAAYKLREKWGKAAYPCLNAVALRIGIHGCGPGKEPVSSLIIIGARLT